MKTIRSILLVTASLFLGEFLASLIPLPVPGTIYGMLLLFLALYTGLVKLEDVEDTTGFLLANMAIFFIPPAVGIMKSYKLILKDLGPVLLIILTSTLITMAITGLVVKKMMGDKHDKN